MPTDSFEKTNLGWQIGQLQQRAGEWWELQTSRFASNLPQMSLPSWWDSPIWGTLARLAFWLILAVLLSWLALRIIGLLSPYFYALRNPLSQSVDGGTKLSESELSVAGWWERSQKFQQRGNYREACLSLYHGMLQRLNDTGIAPHQPSRTDGEYLQLIPPQLPSRAYQTLLMIHQQLCFSNLEASPSVFEECQQAYREIQRV